MPALLPVKESKLVAYLAQGCRCWYCDNVMVLFRISRRHLPTAINIATWEHITPMHRGTSTSTDLNRANNKILACHACNQLRGDRPLTSFIAELRSMGLTHGIVSRIGHLVDDHVPDRRQADLFEFYMRQTLAHPRRPDDALKYLPADLEQATLPDPSQVIPLAAILAKYPPPKPPSKPLLVRLWRNLRQHLQKMGSLLHV